MAEDTSAASNSPDAPKSPDAKQSDRNKSDANDNGAHRGRSRWPLIAAGIVVVIFVAVVLWIIFHPKTAVTTDDAYVSVHYATVAPRVSGQIATVAVTDNQLVHRGQLLATLDDRDYQASLDRANAALARDMANETNAGADVARQPAEIARAQAAVDSARAQLTFTLTNARRYTNLASTGAGTTQQQQSADMSVQQDRASLRSAQAGLEAAQRQLQGLKARRSAIAGTVQLDRAEQHQAELNLSYTRLLAPIDGMVGELSTQIGNYVTPGAALMSVVPLHDVYIEANYREVDLRHVETGQPVRIHLDAYNIDLDGIVDSVPPATGTTFSPIQPDNATGNFTKIVQRLPVKIVIAPNQPLAKLLRVGLSVETTIDTGLADVASAQRASPSPVTAPESAPAAVPVTPPVTSPTAASSPSAS